MYLILKAQYFHTQGLQRAIDHLRDFLLSARQGSVKYRQS